MQRPILEEVLQAFKAGYRAIDEGDRFYDGFNAYLESLGYKRLPDSACTCPDQGRHGHLPECRWVKP